MADYELRLEHVKPRALAVARGAAARGNLGPTIIGLLDKVWPVLRAQGIRTGHNVVMYLDDLAHLESGVEIFGDFSPTAEVHLSATPSGLAATARKQPYLTGFGSCGQRATSSTICLAPIDSGNRVSGFSRRAASMADSTSLAT